MAASSKQDRDLSEAVFHSKYGFAAGWDEVLDMVYAAMNDHEKDERVREVLYQLWHSAMTKRAERRDAYVDRIDL